MKKTIIRDILKVFAVGGTSAFMSAAAIFFAYLSIVIYCDIPTAGGYIAVLAFALATFAAAAALAIVYMCGAWIVRKGKFAR